MGPKTRGGGEGGGGLWTRELSLERLLLPEYQWDDRGLSAKLCLLSAVQPIRTRDEGASASLWFYQAGVSVLPLDGSVLHSAACRGRRRQAVDECDWTGRLANRVSVSRQGFFSCNFTDFQIEILSKQQRGNTHDKFHLRAAGSAPSDRKCARPRVFLSLPQALIGCAL